MLCEGRKAHNLLQVTFGGPLGCPSSVNIWNFNPILDKNLPTSPATTPCRPLSRVSTPCQIMPGGCSFYSRLPVSPFRKTMISITTCVHFSTILMLPMPIRVDWRTMGTVVNQRCFILAHLRLIWSRWSIGFIPHHIWRWLVAYI